MVVSSEYFSATSVGGLASSFVAHDSIGNASRPTASGQTGKIGTTRDFQAIAQTAGDELAYALLDVDKERSTAPFRPGENIDAIVARAALTRPAEPWNPNSVLSKSEKADRTKLIAKANDGIKSYRPHDNQFDVLLLRSKTDVKNLSHKGAKQLLRSAGADHVNSAHAGSTFDSFVSAVPKALFKTAIGSGVGQAARTAESLQLAGVLRAITEVAVDAIGAAAKSTGRIGVTSMTDSWDTEMVNNGTPQTTSIWIGPTST